MITTAEVYETELLYFVAPFTLLSTEAEQLFFLSQTKNIFVKF